MIKYLSSVYKAIGSIPYSTTEKKKKLPAFFVVVKKHIMCDFRNL